jgi:hypothetical protein
MQVEVAYTVDAVLSSRTLSKVLVRERMSRKGSPTKLDFRAGSIVPKVGRRRCSSSTDPTEDDTVAVLARRKE